MSTEQIIGISGGVASIIGLGIALLQYLKYKKAKESLEKLKEIRNTQLWGSITLLLETYNTLEEAKELLNEDGISQELSLKVISARKSTVAQYLRLLEQAILDHPNFTTEIAEKWREKGLLQSDWELNAAIKLAKDSK
ncbi:MAG: hypothetical protein M9916_13795 [Crocinitomicaceae bacterium]|nr:hypothetical protein [Crocinitomicaceae bacterium]